MPGNQEDEELGQSWGVDGGGGGGGGGGGREGASARGAPGHSRGGRKRVMLTRWMTLTMACVVALALAGTVPKMVKWVKDRDSRRRSLWARKMKDELVPRISRGQAGARISIPAGGEKVLEEGAGMVAMERDQSIGSGVQGGVDVAGHDGEDGAESASRTGWKGNETVQQGVAAAKSASNHMPPPPPPPSAMSLNGHDPSTALSLGRTRQTNETMTTTVTMMMTTTTTTMVAPTAAKKTDEGIRPGNASEHGSQHVVVEQPSQIGGLSTTASGTGRGGRKQRDARQEEGDSIAMINPTIAECNLPDIAVVPRAYPQLSVGAEESDWWSSCYFWNTSRTNGTFRALFRGRMANGMLQYFWNRVKADSNRWGLEPTNAQRHDGTPWVSPVREYEHAEMGSLPGAPSANVFQQGCGPHFQQYINYRYLRCKAQCVFKPKKRLEMANSTAFSTLGPNDVVIHYREPFELMTPMINKRITSQRNRTHPPFEYFDRILKPLNQSGQLGKIWIVAEWKLEQYPPEIRPKNIAMHRVIQEYGATFVKGHYTDDHYLARQAPIFIGSFGTFSWTVAYLSVARQIHLPYDPTEKAGSSWNRWNTLFIDDDDRIRYHDAFARQDEGCCFKTANQVIQEQTKFGMILRKRTKEAGHCDPTNIQTVQGDKTLWKEAGKVHPDDVANATHGHEVVGGQVVGAVK